VSRSAGDGDASPADKGVIKARLNALFAMTNPDTGKAYINADVARATGVSPSLIAQMRQGTKDNPTMNTVEALAEFFGVTPDYFSKHMTDEHVARVVAGLQLLDAAENAGVKALLTRASGLSAESLSTIRAMVETARKAEGLDDRKQS
jgi:transcriptional regulator with XRE-family HTH domain